MARILSGAVSTPFPVSNLIACDPTGLNTENVKISSGQGRLEPGTLLQRSGARATAAANVHGVLHEYIDTETGLPAGSDVAAAVYTKGRFIWQTVQKANPALTIDAAFADAVRPKGITFEWAAGWEPLLPAAGIPIGT